MQVWWTQAHVFGEAKTFNWMRVSVLLAAAFDLLFYVFLKTLTKNTFLALIGLALFLIPPDWLVHVNPLAVSQMSGTDLLLKAGWLDQPDLWTNCLTLGALLVAMREKWGWTLLLTGIAIAFKESGMMIFPLVALVMLGTARFSRIPAWVYGASAVMLGLMMYARWLAGPLVFQFHSYGNDVSGPTRYWIAMSPLAFGALFSLGQTLFALGTSGVILWRQKSILVTLGCLLGCFFLSVVLVSWQNRLALDVAFAHLIDSGWKPMSLLVAWVLFFTILLKNRELLKHALLLTGCALVAALPFAMATQAGAHCLALGRAFEAGFGACWAVAIGAAILSFVKKRFPNFEVPKFARGFISADSDPVALDSSSAGLHERNELLSCD